MFDFDLKYILYIVSQRTSGTKFCKELYTGMCCVKLRDGVEHLFFVYRVIDWIVTIK